MIVLAVPRPAASVASALASAWARASACSSSVTCRLKVATSMTFVPKRTCARRNRRPMMKQFRNSFLIWYGCASVPMSKSLGRLPAAGP